jgi:NADH:ubiquinone oxidoreductase subunit 5 (subunit L)/multisubunit Na+/H+ antiporter MnhA subunit
VLASGAVTQQLPWAPTAGLALDVRVDGFALLRVTLVSGVGVLVFAYSAWCFPPDLSLGRFTAMFVAFVSAMLGVVLVGNLLVLYRLLGADRDHVVSAHRL